MLLAGRLRVGRLVVLRLCYFCLASTKLITVCSIFDDVGKGPTERERDMTRKNVFGSEGRSGMTDQPVLTVGQLRQMLKGMNDKTHVVIADGDGWYLNIEATAKPVKGDDSSYCCVTFFASPSNRYDSRQ